MSTWRPRTRDPVRPQPGFIAPCIPTRADRVPWAPGRIHENKHDGYRLIVRRTGNRVRLFTRPGFDWSERYPLVVAGALKVKAEHFVIDGEACLTDLDGVADFNALHSRLHDASVFLWAFDLLELEG
jgi:bifunctional non-homologous end joining protein LigD